jgi:hypothetical protein
MPYLQEKDSYTGVMLVIVYFSFCIIVTALIEYSCLRNVTNKLYGQSLVSVRNTPLHCREYNKDGTFCRRRKRSFKQIHL